MDVIVGLKKVLIEHKKSIDEKEKELQKLREQNEKEENASADLKDRISDLVRDLEDNKGERGQLSERIDELQKRLEHADKKNDDEKDENLKLREEIRNLKKDEQGIVGKIADVLRRSPSKKVSHIMQNTELF